MSGNAGQHSSSSKANVLPTSSSSSVPFHPTASPIEGGFNRRAGGSGSFGAGSTSRIGASPRSNQSKRDQHKRQRRQRLLDDEDYSESAVMRTTTSRKGQTSITHLMNFSLPPRPQYHPQNHRNSRRYQSWGMGSGYHAADKARYVHANYRFIVDPNRSYHAQAVNADVHLDWDSVLQILVSAQTQSASCPICLSTPVAPRMARCGHIFCLPCLIRFMHSTDDENPLPERKARWKKCPICWDIIYISEARPVRWFRGQEGDLPVEGADVVLRLVKREPGSTLALPRDGAESLGPGEDLPWYHAAEVADYARIMKGGEEYMNGQYDAEIAQLRRQEMEDELIFGEDPTWTRKAIAAITDAKEKVRGIGNPPDMPRRSADTRDTHETEQSTDHLDAVQHLTDVPSGQIAEVGPSTVSNDNSSGDQCNSDAAVASAPDLSTDTDRLSDAMGNVQLGQASRRKHPPRVHGNTPASQHLDQPYYFYQALPHFYLSSLDIRILKAAFGDYSLFPATILPRVERVSTGHTVDDDLRKRAKYLGHLPQGCEVAFLECDWSDVVVPEVLDRFRPEIERRRKRNREKVAREEKERIRAEKEEEEKRWAAARRRRPSFVASDPPFRETDFQPLFNGSTGDAPPDEEGDIASSASPPSQRPRFGVLSSPSTSPPGARTVWGTAAVPPLVQNSDSDAAAAAASATHDGWLQGWEEELLSQRESEIIAQSLADSQNQSSASAGGKKKKNKKITLMSTNIQRGA